MNSSTNLVVMNNGGDGVRDEADFVNLALEEQFITVYAGNIIL